MQINNPPSKIVLPFAEGDPSGRATIPVTTATPGYASLTYGFPAITRTPKAAGGIPPRGVDMNGILNAISAIARWSAAGGGYKYDSTFANDTNVAGYPKGAEVLNSAGLGRWLNLADGNTADPDAGGANWVQTWLSGTTAANGYIVLPVVVGTSVVRFIVQWATGVPSGTGDGPQTITLPIAYPNAVLHVGVTTQGNGSSFDDGMFQYTSSTLTSVTLYKGNFSGNAPVLTPQIFTIGY